MIKCSEVDCEREARFAPKICVPAQGQAIDTHQPIEVTIRLPLCREHCEDFHFKETLALENGVRQAVETITAALRKAPPDFDRAFIRPIRLDSPEYRAMERAAETRQPLII